LRVDAEQETGLVVALGVNMTKNLGWNGRLPVGQEAILRKVGRMVRLEEIPIVVGTFFGRKCHAKALVDPVEIAEPQPARAGPVGVVANIYQEG
jgi:hypothetical protein